MTIHFVKPNNNRVTVWEKMDVFVGLQSPNPIGWTIKSTINNIVNAEREREREADASKTSR